MSGTNLTVRGAPGSFLDGHGVLYWDGMYSLDILRHALTAVKGEGNGGGLTKPKFFKANYMYNSVLDSITILNAPLNSFSINYVDGLILKDIVVNDVAGDVGELGHNTDGFNINNANNVLITGAKVWNQDDCKSTV